MDQTYVRFGHKMLRQGGKLILDSRRFIVACFLVLGFFAASGLGATYTVTNNTDIDDGNCDANCSLREAVNQANLTVEADTIVFAPSVTGTIIIGSELQITNALTITGPGARLLAVDGNQSTRIFDITTTGSLEMSGVTVQRGMTPSGQKGAGIQNLGNCVLTNVSIVNNVADGGGGGISNEGTLTIDSSTISGNSATSSLGGGAGIILSGNVAVIRNSTISGNSTAAGSNALGGGIAITVGNLSVPATDLSLINVTITNNFSGGGGGGIFLLSNLNVSALNSLIANNTAGTGFADVDNFTSQNVTSRGNNLVRAPKPGIGFNNGVNGDIVGVDPLLDVLSNNGGPTDTHALLTGSPAIDAGNDCVFTGTCGVTLTTDQRGVSRLSQTHVDIGAYEALGPTAAQVAISGQVTNGSFGIAGATVQLLEQDGTVRSARTSSFGYFRFDGIEVGQGVILRVNSKSYTFEPRFISLVDEVTDLVITPIDNARFRKDVSEKRIMPR